MTLSVIPLPAYVPELIASNAALSVAKSPPVPTVFVTPAHGRRAPPCPVRPARVSRALGKAARGLAGARGAAWGAAALLIAGWKAGLWAFAALQPVAPGLRVTMPARSTGRAA